MSEKKPVLKRAISVTQLYTKKRNLLKTDGEWKALFGEPELTGAWLIWGESGSGKTTFVAKLAKYMTKFGRVAYDSLEEGDSESMKMAFIRVGMDEVKRKLILLPDESIEDLKIRLRQHKAPQIVIIDSLQYSGMSYNDYKELRREFKNVLFIIISHAEGKNPDGKVAKKIRYDAFVKIRVEGYKAFAVSRYGSKEPMVVWQEGADKFHGMDALKV